MDKKGRFPTCELLNKAYCVTVGTGTTYHYRVEFIPRFLVGFVLLDH